MNKYQKSLNSLNPNYLGKQEYSWRRATELLQELVDKETPKKVTHQATIYVCCTCPNCLNVIDEFEENYLGKRIRVTYDYCRFCGQKLDWSECENE